MDTLQSKQTVVPYFMVLNAQEFVEFTQRVFHSEVITVEKADGTEGVIHGEMKIGNSTIYYADTSHDGSCGPGVCGDLKEDGLVPIQMMIFVEDVADTHKRALDAGATSVMEVTEENGNIGAFVDPFTNLWWIYPDK